MLRNLALRLFCLLCFRIILSDGVYYTTTDDYIINSEELRRQDTIPCPMATVLRKSEQPRARTLRLDHAIACNVSWEVFVNESLHRDARRAELVALDATVPTYSGLLLGTGNYLATIGFGTPLKNYPLVVDTGSDITWIQCLPCTSCYKQSDPTFDPKASSSYSIVSCGSALCKLLSDTDESPVTCKAGYKASFCPYRVDYRDGSSSAGDLSLETLHFGSEIIKNFSFGCGHRNRGLFGRAAGLFGLGRGSVAFPAQTKSQYGGRFSYCLPDYGDTQAGGSLSIGAGSIPSSATFTPMLMTSPPTSFYVAALKSVQVGFLSVGMSETASIVDSGTVISRLTPTLYAAVKDAFKNQTASLPAAPSGSVFDTCFDLSKVKQIKVPRIFFVYRGNATVEVSVAALLLPLKSDLSQVCLAFASHNANYNIIGNFQQQRTLVAYDNSAGRIGFLPQKCSDGGGR